MSPVIRGSADFRANLRCKSEVGVGRRGSGSLQKFMARDDSSSFCGMFCLWVSAGEGRLYCPREACVQSTALISCAAAEGRGKGHPSPPLSFYLPTKDFHYQCVHYAGACMMATVQPGPLRLRSFSGTCLPLLSLLSWAGTPLQCHKDNSSEHL